MIRKQLLKLGHLWARIVPFAVISFSRQGLGSHSGRLLIWGKIRRTFISLFPAWARALRKKHGIEGGCVSCGASCNLLFRCPQWDPKTHLCTVYEYRPNICKLFPITPADLRDRDLVLKDKPCGFHVVATSH